MIIFVAISHLRNRDKDTINKLYLQIYDSFFVYVFKNLLFICK